MKQTAQVSRPLACVAALSCGLAVSLIQSGCGGSDPGPELGQVSGTVTLDGSPLEGATVTFSPQDGGRFSSAVTNSAGEYSLQYTPDREGALIGLHTVRITTFKEPSEDDEGNEIPGTPETVPSNYNSGTTLSEEVAADGNEISFQLESGGEIVQPE